MAMDLYEYCDDMLDLDYDLMSDEQKMNACKSYAEYLEIERKYSNSQNFVATEEIKEQRKFAKKFGGKALTGTAKQKKWAEQIRYEKLQKMLTVDEKIVCIAVTQKEFLASKFWIENRNKSEHEICEFIKRHNELYKNICVLIIEFDKIWGDDNRNAHAQKYFEAVRIYNDYTENWFKELEAPVNRRDRQRQTFRVKEFTEQ